jgi:hypothetical protein
MFSTTRVGAMPIRRFRPERGGVSEDAAATTAPRQAPAPAAGGIIKVRREGAVPVGALALGAAALGAIAIGPLAVGAVAFGRVAIGRLDPGQAKLRRGRVDDLRIARLTVEELRVLRVQGSKQASGNLNDS